MDTTLNPAADAPIQVKGVDENENLILVVDGKDVKLTDRQAIALSQAIKRPLRFQGHYQKAQAFIIEHQVATISRIQRHLQVGYNLAASIMERLEENGHVTPAAPDGSRKVITQPGG